MDIFVILDNLFWILPLRYSWCMTFNGVIGSMWKPFSRFYFDLNLWYVISCSWIFFFEQDTMLKWGKCGGNFTFHINPVLLSCNKYYVTLTFICQFIADTAHRREEQCASDGTIPLLKPNPIICYLQRNLLSVSQAQAMGRLCACITS